MKIRNIRNFMPGHDPYTLACKARPPSTDVWTFLSVIVIVIVIFHFRRDGTPLGPTKGGTLYDAQGHMIEPHGTRTVCKRLGREGHSKRLGREGLSAGAEVRVTSVKSPILSMKRQGYRFGAGPTVCKMSKRGIAA